MQRDEVDSVSPTEMACESVVWKSAAHLLKLDSADELDRCIELSAGIGVLRIDRQAFLEVKHGFSWAKDS